MLQASLLLALLLVSTEHQFVNYKYTYNFGLSRLEKKMEVEIGKSNFDIISSLKLLIVYY